MSMIRTLCVCIALNGFLHLLFATTSTSSGPTTTTTTTSTTFIKGVEGKLSSDKFDKSNHNNNHNHVSFKIREKEEDDDADTTTTASAATVVDRPTGLLCNFQRRTALGVGPIPQFSWIVPRPSSSSSSLSQPKKNALQYAYRIQVVDYDDQEIVMWDSGKVLSNQSTSVKYGDIGDGNSAGTSSSPTTQRTGNSRLLESCKMYSWRVQTWTASPNTNDNDDDGDSRSRFSRPAKFITARSFHHGGTKTDNDDDDDELESAFDNKNYQYQFIRGNDEKRIDQDIPSTYGYFRRTLDDPPFHQQQQNTNASSPISSSITTSTTNNITSAIAYITAASDDHTLSAYKLYVNGNLVSVGPGRSEAPIWNGNGEFQKQPTSYRTLDITSNLVAGRPNLLAIASVHRPGGPRVWMELIVRYTTSSTATPAIRRSNSHESENSSNNRKLQKVLVIGTDSKWLWREADSYYNPKNVSVWPAPGGGGLGLKESGTENIDARKEAYGWKTNVILSPSEAALWSPAMVADDNHLHHPRHALMSRPIEIQDWMNGPAILVPTSSNRPDTSTNTYMVDFQREFQGGLRIKCLSGIDGVLLEITSGELYDTQTHTLSQTYGYTFNWTLRDGEQMLEQHKYMEFRYITIRIIHTNDDDDGDDGDEVVTPESLGMTVSAWTAQMEYYPSDTYFQSDHDLLNRIWELCRYTLQAGVLETYTDSNTRERRPYEADGLIAATARNMIQREFMWARHSHSYVMEYPTWPTEWQQMTPNLVWEDYQATGGTTDLFQAYEEVLYTNTKWRDHLDTNISSEGFGLIFTNWTDGPLPARHIIGWDPEPREYEFHDSEYQFPCNAFAYRGLKILAKLVSKGNTKNQYALAARDLRRSILSKMWNKDDRRFCDGICSQVNNATGPYSNLYGLYLGLVPKEAAADVWKLLVNYSMPGNSSYGDYGAFALQYALSDFDLFGDGEGGGHVVEKNGGGDDGTAMLRFLTKCDEDSWCAEMEKFNSTMTGEAFNNGFGTRSHPWGTAAIPAIVQGLAGIQRTSPGYESVTIKPRLGGGGGSAGDGNGIKYLSLRIPTLMGYIDLHVSQVPRWELKASIPCNTLARLCLPMAEDNNETAPFSLLLDGVEVGAFQDGRHVCVNNVGCGTRDRPTRILTRPLQSPNNNSHNKVYKKQKVQPRSL